ncbi:hypothetical protein AXG93_789s1060 [Marchantia polymorpha subsp. ruderalis]|uniref:Uncharacterized protein n=1 Tax=Marchantia polymorpha subsp. ruderalis TaxID=1480154 RepID=A0A176VI53_MARPO|nr:hypothetical protein AXG93_789s1060 [Marchantia polymorpha subsp. ruderalis]
MVTPMGTGGTESRFWPKVIAFERYSAGRGSDILNMWRFLQYDDNSSSWQVVSMLYNCSIKLKKVTTTVRLVPDVDVSTWIFEKELTICCWKRRRPYSLVEVPLNDLDESPYLQLFQHGGSLYIARGMAGRNLMVDIWKQDSERNSWDKVGHLAFNASKQETIRQRWESGAVHVQCQQRWRSNKKRWCIGRKARATQRRLTHEEQKRRRGDRSARAEEEDDKQTAGSEDGEDDDVFVDHGRRTSQNLQCVLHLTNTELRLRLDQLIPQHQARLKYLKTENRE